MRRLCIGLAALALALSGCATREVGTVRPVEAAAVRPEGSPMDCPAGKIVWVTIDGTSNTPVSRTAAARLHEMVESFSYTRSGRPLAVWYAEGVGSADSDLDGKALGVGVDEDIRKAYAFLTQVWQPGDCLFFNGFSRGAYSVRALAGLLYVAGIPDLRAHDAKSRRAITRSLFKAYKTAAPLPDRAQRIKEAYEKLGVSMPGGRRSPGFLDAATGVTVEAMTIWDSVQALGLPDKGESPIEGPGYFLITACNTRAIFQPLSLDDNRAYSFTPILAGGLTANGDCRNGGKGKQDANKVIRETWFSGAHADVGGTYQAESAMLDGELSSISLNWILGKLSGWDCPGCGWALALPKGLRIPEDRLAPIHDGKETSDAYTWLFRQNRKPRAYWRSVYDDGTPMPIHASVFDRLEWLFALNHSTPGCNNQKAPGKPVLCAGEIASYGLVPELVDKDCLVRSDWGFQLRPDQDCVAVVGRRSGEKPPLPNQCTPSKPGEDKFIGWAYRGEPEKDESVFETKKVEIPYPRCVNSLGKMTSQG